MGGRNEQAARSGRHNQGQRGEFYHYVSAIKSTRRNVKALSQDSFNKYKEAQPNTIARIKIDSNADSCCLGKNFAMLSPTERTADVFPYDSSYEPIVSAATALDDPQTGVTWLLIINEGLFLW